MNARLSFAPYVLFVLCVPFFSASALAADVDEFKIKREAVFEFAQKPVITREGDKATIAFETKGLCDVTVAIENMQGRIIRHLACGVLGPKAPAPLQKDSKKQTLVWDGKDDQGTYVDDKAKCVVRVSLGLKPAFERNLFFFPKRRNSRFPPLMAAQPEGVYVFDGGLSADHVRLFSHSGEYIRTVYPFPADKIAQVQGLPWHAFPQDGQKLPIKGNFTQMSFLTSGDNAMGVTTYKPDLQEYKSAPISLSAHYGQRGAAATAMAVAQGRMALADILLNRLATDGSTGGLALTGPSTSMEYAPAGKRGGDTRWIVPRSAALSPDGKTLYLSGYVFARTVGHASADIVTYGDWDTYPVVRKMDITRDDPPQVFVGSEKLGETGSGPKQLNTPACVTTDSSGQVYVADYLNNRIQVFSPAGEQVKSIPANRPGWVRVHQKTGEIYVFSWRIATNLKEKPIQPTLTVFSPLPAAAKQASYDLPVGQDSDQGLRYGTTFCAAFAELDSWAEPTTFWLVRDWPYENVLTRQHQREDGISLHRIEKGKVVTVARFEEQAQKARVRASVHRHHRQRLYVNPKTGRVLLTEGDAFNDKSFKDAWEIDPETAAIKYIQLPFDAEDMCFDSEGLAYLRTINLVVRYDPTGTWREIPWDYGEERQKVHTSSCGDRKVAPALSALVLPANGGWHHGGLWVSPKGHLAAACGLDPEGLLGKALAANPIEGVNEANVADGMAYQPQIYPGRGLAGRGGATLIHVWDRKGTLIKEDVLPGLCDTPLGIGIDNDDGIYLLASPTRVLDGKRYFNDMCGTLMKVLPNKAKIYSEGKSTPVPLTRKPDRNPDLVSGIQGTAWVENAEWMYGGVGWMGKNRGVGCGCFNARMAFDYFNRSFVPELDRYSVAVLDGSGNLILRIGRYGNADDGKPLDSAGGPPAPRSIGGDEVALMHGAYLATHTDKRLFISDAGNARMISVRLNYAASETIALKDVADTPEKK